METNFNFKSQICTTREQSERLIALGLKKETADIEICCLDGEIRFLEEEDYQDTGITIPAWSLHRLIEMCDINPFVFYTNCGYDNVIDRIEDLIKDGELDKEYLV